MSKKYPKKPKKGDKVVCTDDMSDNEDLGMSGIVLPGRRDLQKGKKYEIERVISDRNVPTNERKTWSNKDYQMVRWSWYEVKLKGVSDSVFLTNFDPVE